MLSNLLSSINDNVYEFLDKLVFITPDITKSLSPIIGTNNHFGITLICNSLVYGFLLYYGLSYLISHITFSQIETPLQFIFKLLLCTLALNASEFICSGLISIFSHASNIVCELGKYMFGFDVSFSGLIQDIIPKDYFLSNSFSLFSFDGLVNTSISFGFLSLSISYVIRYIILKVLIIIAPFAILSLSSNKSSWFFKAWFKNFIALLFLQVFIAIILLVCFIIDDKDRFLPSQIMYIGMIYSLFKANSFVREFIGGFSTDTNFSFSNISSIFKGGASK